MLSFPVLIATYALLPWHPAYAGDVMLYKMLLEKGVINQQQYEQLLKYNELQQEEEITKKQASEAKIATQAKLKFQSKSGDFQYQIGGRTMVDVGIYHSDKTPLNNSTEFRRVRLFVKGQMFKDWIWKTQYDFTGSGSLKDVYLGYTGLGNSTILRFGNFGGKGSLEDMISSKYITFMERALPVSAFAPSTRYIGIGLDTSGDKWSFGVALAGENGGTDELERDGLGLSSRMTYAPWHQKDQLLHLGISGTFRIPRGDDRIRFRTRPEAHADDTKLVDTGWITGVDNYTLFGLETAWVNGSFSLQGEYMRTDVARDKMSSLTFGGGYLYGSWFLTGESRNYSVANGAFGRIKPKQPLDKGGMGAWEIGLRLSSLALEDQDIRGGKEDNLTLGINWYINSHIRFMLNYVKAKVEDATTSSEDEKIDIVEMRVQIDF